jgi:hypothetical protein
MAKKAWVITVDMGYGHQRAAFPLRDMAYEKVITANSQKVMTDKEWKKWNRLQAMYESISRLKSVPIIGGLLWNIYDKFQSISPYYPFRDLSKPSFGSIYINNLIKKGFLKSIVDYTKKKELPMVSTFYATALASAHAKLKTYCVVTDTDINRIWVSEKPKENKIVYLTPSDRATNRLVQYGIPRKNIIFTGFPLPKENIGKNMKILNEDLNARLLNLDPNKIFIKRYESVIKNNLGDAFTNKKTHPLTITFAIGGAGAQQELVLQILSSLKNDILNHRIKVNLIAGTRPNISQKFIDEITKLGLKKEIDNYINILCNIDRNIYFESFNKILRTTDILWTKPSELSFFTGLGIPIIIAPPIGYHEIINEKWLVTMGSGIKQENPKYINEWLFDWVNKGILAQAAWEGYIEAPKNGTYNIEKVVLEGKEEKDLKF